MALCGCTYSGCAAVNSEVSGKGWYGQSHWIEACLLLQTIVSVLLVPIQEAKSWNLEGQCLRMRSRTMCSFTYYILYRDLPCTKRGRIQDHRKSARQVWWQSVSCSFVGHDQKNVLDSGNARYFWLAKTPGQKQRVCTSNNTDTVARVRDGRKTTRDVSSTAEVTEIRTYPRVEATHVSIPMETGRHDLSSTLQVDELTVHSLK